MIVPPVEFDASSLSARIHIVASELLGFRYGKPGFPRAPGGLAVSAAVSDSKTIDCSSLTTYVLIEAFPHAPWSIKHYKDLQVFDAARPMSPIDAAINVGIGQRAPVPWSGQWHLMQTWRGLSPLEGGHARLVWARNDTLHVLESTNADSKVGPRWSTMSWVAIQSKYEAVGLAVLGDRER